MPLPTTIIGSGTITWSDHRNQSHGGVQRVTSYASNSDNGTFYNLGDTHDRVARIAAYGGQSGHKLVRFRCYLQRVGSPTGNVLIEVRPTISSTIPDLATLWGTSRAFPVSSIPTSGKNEVIFTFPVPVALPSSDSTSFAIVLTVSAQGDSSNYIKVYKGVNGDTGTTHAYGAGSQVWTGSGFDGTSFSHVVEISKSGARVTTVDKTNNRIDIRKTDDNNGASWSSESTSSTITSTANLKTVNAQASINDLGTTYFGSCGTSSSLVQYKRTESATSQDPASGPSLTSIGTNVSGTAPVFNGRRTSGVTVMVAQGATETIMGTARRRIKLSFYNGSVWSSIFDVQGSTNTPNATLPGDGVDYDLRWAALDPNGDFHIVYSKSDSSTLQYRKFKSDNTFATINTLNGAVASATANYPIGQGTFLYKGTDWYVAIPYVDNSSSTLKEARCKIVDTATSANWVLTQIVAANAEVSGSNPAVLIADNMQGGKVFCVRVKPTTKGLAMTHDSGSGTWVAETDWRGATQTCGGISGFYTEDGIALVYLEESTTPDELRYDRL